MTMCYQNKSQIYIDTNNTYYSLHCLRNCSIVVHQMTRKIIQSLLGYVTHPTSWNWNFTYGYCCRTNLISKNFNRLLLLSSISETKCKHNTSLKNSILGMWNCCQILLWMWRSCFNWSLRTLLSNLLEGVRGNSGTIFTKFTC